MLRRLERGLESLLFASRWLLAPFYFGLAAGLVLLLARFVLSAVDLVLHGLSGGEDHLIVAVLGLVDLSLVANLVLMVMFSGYENFVSRMHAGDHPDRPDWIGHTGFGELKLKLMTSIVAISAIHVLEDFHERALPAGPGPRLAGGAAPAVHRQRRPAGGDGPYRPGHARPGTDGQPCRPSPSAAESGMEFRS